MPELKRSTYLSFVEAAEAMGLSYQSNLSEMYWLIGTSRTSSVELSPQTAPDMGRLKSVNLTAGFIDEADTTTDNGYRMLFSRTGRQNRTHSLCRERRLHVELQEPMPIVYLHADSDIDPRPIADMGRIGRKFGFGGSAEALVDECCLQRWPDLLDRLPLVRTGEIGEHLLHVGGDCSHLWFDRLLHLLLEVPLIEVEVGSHGQLPWLDEGQTQGYGGGVAV